MRADEHDGLYPRPPHRPDKDELIHLVPWFIIGLLLAFMFKGWL